MSDDNTQAEQSPGILGTLTDAVHKLEDGFEHLINDAQQAAQDDPRTTGEGQQSPQADAGNVNASSAGQLSESGAPASAMTASPASGTPVTTSSTVTADQAQGAIAKLRAHLWTFSREAVSALHTELDKLESFIKSV